MFHVKRETARVEPDSRTIGVEVRTRLSGALARLAFEPSTQHFLDRMQTLAELLALWGVRTNLTARPDDPAETTFHILDSLMPLVIARRDVGGSISEMLGKGKRVVDLGSGAGFPGLVLAAACQAHFDLWESRRKRATFLSVAIAEMGLDNAIVQSARAEASSFAGDCDAITARAIGDWPTLWRVATAALRQGGIAILYAGRDQLLDMELARSAGFASCQRIPYEIDRDGTWRASDLILAVKQE